MTLTGDTGYGPGRGFSATRGSWRIPRSRGAVAGGLLLLLGAWGALIPFIGPAFNFGFGGPQTWSWTAARFWLEVLPGCATFLAGLMLLISANRPTAAAGAWLAIAAGTWFVIGPTLATPWHLGDLGVPMGGTARQALTWLLFFYGLGAAILYLSSTAWGRLSIRSLRDLQHAELHHHLKMQARGGRGLFGLGGARRGRKPEPVRAGEYTDEYGEPVGRARRRDERMAPPEHEVYPSDSLRARPADRAERMERPVDAGARGAEPYPSDQSRQLDQSRDQGRQLDQGQPMPKVTGTTERAVSPGETTGPGGEPAAPGGRHEAPQAGFTEKLGHFEEKIGRALAKHGHGIGGRQH
jgi:hypothetical protein